MTAGMFAAVSVAGGAGAALRFMVDGAVRARRPVTTRGGRVWPLGILVVNLTGSLALGVITGLTLHRGAGDLTVVLGVGLLGGYTTFSTASVDAVLLAREGSLAAAVRYVVVTVAGCLLAAGAGLAVGLALSPG